MKKVIEVRRNEAYAAKPDMDLDSPNSEVSILLGEGPGPWGCRATGLPALQCCSSEHCTVQCTQGQQKECQVFSPTTAGRLCYPWQGKQGPG